MIYNKYLIITFILNLLIATFFIKVFKDYLMKIFIFLFSITMFVYTGIGLSQSENLIGYIFSQVFFIFTFYLSLYVTTKISINSNNNVIDSLQKDNILDKWIKNNVNIIKGLVICFFILKCVPLFTPEFRILDFFTFPRPSLQNIFEKREAIKSGAIGSVASAFSNILVNFFFIYLMILKKNKKKFLMILLFLLWLYLDYLETIYMDRNTLVASFLFIMYLIFSDFKTGKVNMKIILIITGLLLLSVPSMLAFESLRLGASSTNLSFKDSLYKLLTTESSYISSLEFVRINNVHANYLEYIKWAITVWIPRFLLGPLKSDFSVNIIYSETILNRKYGQQGFYILLPTLLGESKILLGQTWFFVHAIVLGGLLGTTYKFLRRTKFLEAVLLYSLLSFSKAPRGGSQGVVSSLIVSLITVFILMIMVKYGNRKTQVGD